MSRLLSTIFVTLLAGIAPAFAQNCDSIITHGMRNVSVSQSAESAAALRYFNRCEVNIDSYEGQKLIEAEVEIFGYGGGSGGFSEQERRDRIRNWCETNHETAESNRSSYDESQVIYQGAVAAWAACNTLKSGNIIITPVISADARTVDIGIVYRGAGSSGVQIYNIEAENMTCKSSFPSEPGAVVTYPYEVANRSVQVRCIRANSTQREIEGQTYDVLPRATISVQTAADPFQLYFPDEFSPPAPLQELAKVKAQYEELQQTVRVLQEEAMTAELQSGDALLQLTQVKDFLKQAFANLGSLKAGTDFQQVVVYVGNAHLEVEDEACPAGEFMVGVHKYYEDWYQKAIYKCASLTIPATPW